MERCGRSRGDQALCLVTALLGFGSPLTAGAQPAAQAGHDPTPAQMSATPYPELRTRRELILAGIGAGMLITGAALPVDRLSVPSEGLDPSSIVLGADREIVGNRSLSAGRTSDWVRNASLALPLVLTLALAESGERWRTFGTRGVVYAEALLFSQGSTLLGKVVLSRARPFAYLAEDQRPADPLYDVSLDRAFRSMPSGHASSAWTGAALAMTEELLSRPGAGWVERVGIGLVGGGLAGATSALRIKAGQHFPSDAWVGTGVGLITGVAMPLVHRGRRPLPATKAWLEMAGAAFAGAVVGVAVAR